MSQMVTVRDIMRDAQKNGSLAVYQKIFYAHAPSRITSLYVLLVERDPSRGSSALRVCVAGSLTGNHTDNWDPSTTFLTFDDAKAYLTAVNECARLDISGLEEKH